MARAACGHSERTALAQEACRAVVRALESRVAGTWRQAATTPAQQEGMRHAHACRSEGMNAGGVRSAGPRPTCWGPPGGLALAGAARTRSPAVAGPHGAQPPRRGPARQSGGRWGSRLQQGRGGGGWVDGGLGWCGGQSAAGFSGSQQPARGALAAGRAHADRGAAASARLAPPAPGTTAVGGSLRRHVCSVIGGWQPHLLPPSPPCCSHTVAAQGPDSHRGRAMGSRSGSARQARNATRGEAGEAQRTQRAAPRHEPCRAGCPGCSVRWPAG